MTGGLGAGTHTPLGCHTSASLGTQALHNSTPLHAIEKEEVVVRRVPLRQGLGKDKSKRAQLQYEEM